MRLRCSNFLLQQGQGLALCICNHIICTKSLSLSLSMHLTLNFLGLVGNPCSLLGWVDHPTFQPLISRLWALDEDCTGYSPTESSEQIQQGESRWLDCNKAEELHQIHCPRWYIYHCAGRICKMKEP